MGAVGEQLSDSQLRTLVTVERVGGSISLVAVVLIFIAYSLVRGSRNVQNTFIVFASVSNVGASIACIIAMDGLAAGRTAALCQAQSFLFEMFMQSDPWWSLAMAINVFLVFYFRTSPSAFSKWWWVYCLVCYGGPFVIALSLLLVRRPGRPPVYGEATIWCWVDREWDEIRIYTYYMLIWICIVGSFLCYLMVGYNVFHSRNQIRSFSSVSKSKEATHYEHQPRLDLPDVATDGFYGTVITEVQVIHSKIHTTIDPRELKRSYTREPAHVSFDEPTSEIQSAANQYFSSVTSSAPPKPRTPKKSALTRAATTIRSVASKFIVEDPIKRAYLRTSFLFALSVLVTWIPSSMNRIHGWLAGSSPFEYHLATAAVLPLQGLWNAVIFFVTSWDAVRCRWADGFRYHRSVGPEYVMRDEDRTPDRGAVRDDMRMDSDMDCAETGTMASDVELRRIIESPDRRTSSL